MTTYTRTRSSKTPYSSSGDLNCFVTSDNPTPLYKARQASGELICKAYASTVCQVAGPKVNSGTGYRWRSRSVSGTVTVAASRLMVGNTTLWSVLPTTTTLFQTTLKMCGAEAPQPPTQYEIDLKHTSLSAELNSGIASILVSLAELPKSVKMIEKAIRLLRRPLSDAKALLRLTRREAKTAEGRARILAKAEDLWLEGRYGWRPFIYDLMSWVDAGNSSYSQRLTVRSKLTDIAGACMPTVSEQKKASGFPPVVKEYEANYSYRASCGQTGDLRSQISSFLKVWGALDLVGTVWDLVPLSFVYDWFFNLGDTLKALQVYAFMEERIGWTKIQYTAFVKTTYTYPDVGAYGPDMEILYHVNPLYSPTLERVRTTQRIPVSSFLPTMGLRADLDCGKALDLLAILHKLVRG